MAKNINFINTVQMKYQLKPYQQSAIMKIGLKRKAVGKFLKAHKTRQIVCEKNLT